MSSVILDTDIFSEVLKGRDPEIGRRGAGYIATHGRLAITVVTVVEIVSGWRRLQREDRIGEFLACLMDVEVIPLGMEAASIAGRIEGDLKRAGQTIGRADSMIAAIAIAEACPLVTGNTEHYERIHRLGHDIRLENWRAT